MLAGDRRIQRLAYKRNGSANFALGRAVRRSIPPVRSNAIAGASRVGAACVRASDDGRCTILATLTLALTTTPTDEAELVWRA